MKRNKMTNENLKSLREQEDAEIIRYLEAISQIIERKCKRCDSVLSCLGCVFSQSEMSKNIDHTFKLMRK